MHRILLICLLVSSAFAQSYVSGPVSGLWTLAGSPYHVTDSLYLPWDDTLIIEAGVEVIFDGYYKFEILDNALLHAVGTQELPIHFYPADTAVGWHGLRFLVSHDDSRVQYCIFEGGKAIGEWPDDCGGAILIDEANMTIANCIVKNNFASYGGGIYLSFGKQIIDGNVIINNHADGRAGAIGLDHSSATIINNVICKNSSEGDCGGILCWHYEGAIVNNTICHNTAGTYGGGIGTGNGPFPFVINCIFEGNIAGSYGSQIYSIPSGSLYIAYSAIDTEDCEGPIIVSDGVFSDDPLTDSAEVYMLDSLSPCVNSGAESVYLPMRDTVIYAPLTDLRGYSRPWQSAFDIGAYEYRRETGIFEMNRTLPEVFSINCYPNPFNSVISISIAGPVDIGNSPIEIEIYDISGQQIATWNEQVDSGNKERITPGIKWQPSQNLSSGIYFVNVKIHNRMQTAKIICLR